MAKTSGGVASDTFILHTPLNAVTATTTSAAIDVAGAKKVGFIFTRANHSAGSSAFTVEVSYDGSTWVGYNKLITNVTNTNAQDLTRVATVTLSSNTSEIAMMSTEDAFVYIRVKVTETTDGTHTAKCYVEY